MNRLREVCGLVGRKLARLTQEGSVQVAGNITNRRIVVSLDGGRVRLREPKKGRTKKGRKKFAANWREPRLFIIYAVDEQGRMADDFAPIIDGTLASCDRLFEMLQAYLISLKIADATRILFVADGAAWIWRRIPKLIRTLPLQPDQVQQLIDFWHAVEYLGKLADIPRVPQECRHCGREFPKLVVDPNPLRRQVWDVEIQPVVIEYQQHRCVCSQCGTSTCGQLPEHVVSGTGPVLTSILVLLTSCYRVSRSKAADFARTVCNVPCSTAHVGDLEERTQEVLAPVYQELRDAAPSEARLKINETPVRRGTAKTWLWTFVGSMFTVFRLAATRKATELTTEIGDAYAGVINCDRVKMYFQCERLQWCWAHLKRDFQRLIDSGDSQLRRLGRDVMKEIIQLFHEHVSVRGNEHHRLRDGTISFEQLQQNLAPVR